MLVWTRVAAYNEQHERDAACSSRRIHFPPSHVLMVKYLCMAAISSQVALLV